MKIFFDAEDFKNKPRGIVKTTICLYKACLGIAPDIEFIGIARKPVQTVLPEGFHLVHLRPNLPRDLWRFVTYNAYMGFREADAVHFPANGMIPRMLFKNSRKIVMTLHDVLPVIFPDQSRAGKLERYRRRMQNDINRANIVFTVSEYSKRDIMKHFRAATEPIVLYNAPTLASDSFDPIHDIQGTEDYFLYNGGYDRRKGIESLIRVFLGLHRSRRLSSILYLTGVKSDYSDDFVKLRDEAVEAGVVKELGYVSDRDLVDLMKKSKGLVYPSHYEGFGLPPVEAMNVGSPVITTRHSAIPEVCGDAVLYVDPDDEKQFGDAVIALSRDGALRRELIQKGKKRSERYSWTKSASIFLEQIERMNSRSSSLPGK